MPPTFSDLFLIRVRSSCALCNTLCCNKYETTPLWRGPKPNFKKENQNTNGRIYNASIYPPVCHFRATTTRKPETDLVLATGPFCGPLSTQTMRASLRKYFRLLICSIRFVDIGFGAVHRQEFLKFSALWTRMGWLLNIFFLWLRCFFWLELWLWIVVFFGDSWEPCCCLGIPVTARKFHA